MITIDYIGFIAGTLTTIALLPQVIKSWKTKETKDISLAMFIILATGIFLWWIYGIFIKDWPIILANGLSFLLALTVLIFKLRYK